MHHCSHQRAGVCYLARTVTLLWWRYPALLYFSLFYFTACLASAALYIIWILYGQWSTCWFCPNLSAAGQKALILQFYQSWNPSGKQVEENYQCYSKRFLSYSNTWTWVFFFKLPYQLKMLSDSFRILRRGKSNENTAFQAQMDFHSLQGEFCCQFKWERLG